MSKKSVMPVNRHIENILDSISLINEFNQNYGYNFMELRMERNNKMFQSSVNMKLIRIGEASNKLVK